MSKLINAHNFWLQITSRYNEMVTLENLMKEIMKAPTVVTQEELTRLEEDVRFYKKRRVVDGSWIITKGEYGVCNRCGHIVDIMDGSPHNYCPDCGARMDETCNKLATNLQPCNHKEEEE